MALRALRGAVGFLTRVPVGRSEHAWRALGNVPAAMVPAGYLVGATVAVAFLVPLPPAPVALLYVLAVLGITGITHADGLADVADAAVVHGPPAERRDVMRDTVVGVGGTVAVGVDLVGLALAALALAALPLRAAVALVVAAEVGAKLGMVVLAVLGRPTHEGMGSHVSGAGRIQLVAGLALAAPVGVLTWPRPAAPIALVAAPLVALGVLAWARARLGGVDGDVLGAANELGRLAALHAGVVAWTLW